MIYYTFGLIVAIIYSILLLPNKVGDPPSFNPTIFPLIYNGMIIIPLNKEKAIHLHHWILAFFICLYYYKNNNFAFGFGLGLLFQGLSYSDSYKIICDNPYNKN